MLLLLRPVLEVRGGMVGLELGGEEERMVGLEVEVEFELELLLVAVVVVILGDVADGVCSDDGIPGVFLYGGRKRASE